MGKTGMLLLQLILSVVLVWPMMARAAQPENLESERLTSLLAALVADSHADFITGGTLEFAAITPEQFAAADRRVPVALIRRCAGRVFRGEAICKAPKAPRMAAGRFRPSGRRASRP